MALVLLYTFRKIQPRNLDIIIIRKPKSILGEKNQHIDVLFTICPAAENIRSGGTEVAGMSRCCFARTLRCLYRSPFDSHHSVGFCSTAGIKAASCGGENSRHTWLLRVCFAELTVVFQEDMLPHGTSGTLVAQCRLAYFTFHLMISYFCKIFLYFAALGSNLHLLTI